MDKIDKIFVLKMNKKKLFIFLDGCKFRCWENWKYLRIKRKWFIYFFNERCFLWNFFLFNSKIIFGEFINEKFDFFNVFGYIYLKDFEFGKVEGEISYGYCGYFFIFNLYRILLYKGLWILLYCCFFFFISC